ncbi:hypothetical protein JCM1393_25310 [Clostridium carnis]
MRNFFKVYTPDYKEICRFKKEFEKFESNMTLLRESIFNWLGKKDNNEIEDIETMLIVEIEEINKFSLQSSIFPIVIFFLGIMGTMYKESGAMYIFLIILVTLLTILTIGMIRTTRYYKYYSFLQKMILRYKKEKSK